MAHTVGTAVTSLVTSLAETRTSLMGRALNSNGLRKRDVDSETGSGVRDEWRIYKIREHFMYNPSRRNFVPFSGLPPGSLRENTVVDPHLRLYPPLFLAMNKRTIGHGAERLAFRCFLAAKESTADFVLSPMVAKETNLVERISENVKFHESFCETQNLASFLATEFNRRLQASPSFNSRSTPIITFLPCSILLLEDEDAPDGERGVLLEKMLDVERYGWCKWNDNNGGVEGRAYHAPIDVEFEYEALTEKHVKLQGICEEDSEDDESESQSSVGSARCTNTGVGDWTLCHPEEPKLTPSSYLQAFSHFTYLFTNRKVLVCDLQGSYNHESIPPRFELTDPAIHYRSVKGRRMVYGRTDKGQQGVQMFFNTHRCSDICKLLNLSKKNKNWHKDWCMSHK
jgi:rRNA maturation protein Nop10